MLTMLFMILNFVLNAVDVVRNSVRLVTAVIGMTGVSALMHLRIFFQVYGLWLDACSVIFTLLGIYGVLVAMKMDKKTEADKKKGNGKDC